MACVFLGSTSTTTGAWPPFCHRFLGTHHDTPRDFRGATADPFPCAKKEWWSHMTQNARSVRFGLAMGLIAMAAGWGCNRSPVPSAPSPVSQSATGSAIAPGATINGLVHGGAGLVVRLTGSNVSSQVDASSRFHVQNAPPGPVELVFVGGATTVKVPLAAPASVGEQVDVELELQGNASQLQVEQHTTGNGTELEGQIVSIEPSSRSFRLGSMTVVVSSATTIRSGATALSFSDLRTQEEVHVRGSIAAGSVTAAQIEVRDAGRADPPSTQEAEFTGKVAGIGGACPSVTLTVAGTTVRTDASTAFLKSACGDLTVGAVVEIHGTLQSDATVLATRVQLEDTGDQKPPEAETEFTGSVSGFSGACPSLALNVGGSSVMTNASTEFKDGTCSEIKVGVMVEIKGMTSSGTVVASRVKFER